MKDKWIKVSDRLPEVDTLYLVRALTAKDQPYTWIARYNGKHWSTPRITHWQPIELPKEDDDE